MSWNTKRIVAGIASFAWGVSGAAFAATLTVPGEYATINAAIQAAQNGDEIVVSPGFYGPFIIDKKLTVRSTYDGSDWGIVENTVIIASGNGDIILIENGLPEHEGSLIRGFKLTRDPVTPSRGMYARGIEAGGVDAMIDSCIIENCTVLSPRGPFDPPALGAAISGIHGTIQNCIIRNNHADGGAIAACSGIIRNNVFQNNQGGSFAGCNGFIANNTFYDEDAVGSIAGSTVFNNIMWNSSNNPFSYGGPAPRNCIIKGYTGPGTNIITLDPRFIDPANGDFRLQSNSPAIDAGITTTATSNSDINGVQRGLKGTPPFRGDGSAIDIGAYEFLPRPIAIWIPGGAPDAISPGDTLPIAWQVTANAGAQINLQLFRDQSPRTDFGARSSIPGGEPDTFTGRTTVTLSGALPYSGGYAIRATSAALPSLAGQTPLFTILGLSAIPSSFWRGYP